MSDKYKSVTVITNHDDSDLIASAMFDAGAAGVSVCDKQDFLELIKSDVIWDYVDEDILLQSDDVKVSTIIGLSDTGYEDRLGKILQDMEKFGVRYGEISIGEIDSADYENEWKKYYKPIKTENITIVPTWINYDASEGERVMRLDPGMAFGTGEHATTRMCLSLMDVENKSVIDVGCGSGILGIASALCGASSVYMCDIDAQAVEYARKNALLNNVDAKIEAADLLSGEIKADVIFANITADILMRLSENIGERLNEGGAIILSGIIASRLDEVKACFLRSGFVIVNELSEDDWRALKLAKA